MANYEFKTHRVTELPVVLEAYSVYYVAPSETTDYVEIYVSSADGTTARRVINENDVKALISDELSSLNEIHVYETIQARNDAAITNSQFAYVVDASGDDSVSAGGASYIYDTASEDWIKTSESESMDFVFNWDKIIGKPSSTAAAIDDAVSKAHTHVNKTSLDKIGQDVDGNLTYDGKTIAGTTQWTTTNW